MLSSTSSCSSSASRKPFSVLNLRHYRGLGEHHFHLIPSDVQQLLIGPSFDPHILENANGTDGIRTIVRHLPSTIKCLDIDLTQMNHLVRLNSPTTNTTNQPTTAGNAETAQINDNDDIIGVVDPLVVGYNNNNNDTTTTTTMNGCMTEFFERMERLESLSLRTSQQQHGDACVVAVAQSLLMLQKQQHCLEDKSWNRGANTTRPYKDALRVLDFRDCRVTDRGIRALADILPCASVTTLILSWSHLSESLTTCHRLAQALSHPSTRLQRLDLNCIQGLDDDSMILLIRSLRYNTTLLELSIFGCTNITDRTGRRLLQCLRDGATTCSADDDDGSRARAGGHNGAGGTMNTTIVKVDMKGTNISKDMQNDIDYYLQLNRAGRKYLQMTTTRTPTTTTPIILSETASSTAVVSPGPDHRPRPEDSCRTKTSKVTTGDSPRHHHHHPALATFATTATTTRAEPDTGASTPDLALWSYILAQYTVSSETGTGTVVTGSSVGGRSKPSYRPYYYDASGGVSYQPAMNRNSCTNANSTNSNNKKKTSSNDILYFFLRNKTDLFLNGGLATCG